MKPSRLIAPLARAQVQHPWWFIALVAALSALAGYGIVGLKFDSGYWALMPPDARQVRDAEIVRDRTGGSRQLVVIVEGDDPDARLDLGRKLASLISRLDGVIRADVKFDVGFFEKRGIWFLDPSNLDELTERLQHAIDLEKARAHPLALHLDEQMEKEQIDEAWAEVETLSGADAGLPLSGVLESPEGRHSFVLVSSSVRVMDLESVRTMFDGIDAIIAELDPASRDMSVRYTGKYTMVQEENQVLRRDLRNASILALVLGFALVALFTRKLSAPFIVAAGLLPGIVWTLALANVVFGQLNIITGFLVAVLVGLGIDFGIHIVVRHDQERNLDGLDNDRAVARTVTGTLPPALTAALTTAGAFSAMLVSDFRGFSEFGGLAATGVVLTLVSSFLVIPALLRIAYGRRRAAPSPRRTSRWTHRQPSAVLCAVLVAVFTAVAILGLAMGSRLRFVNDFARLRGQSDVTELFEWVDSNIGLRFDPAVILVDDIEDARRVQEIASDVSERRRATGRKSYLGNAISAADMIPPDPEASTARIEKLETILLDPRLDSILEEGGPREDKLRWARESVSTRPWDVDDLPDALRARATTLDGSQLVVLLWSEDRIMNDILAVAWDEELQEIRDQLETEQIEHTLSAETLMPAWVSRMIVSQTPRLLALAALIVLLMTALHLRRVRTTMLVIAPIAAGMLVMVAVMVVTGMHLDMFNIIVFPAVMGIGIDNVLHIHHRYRSLGPGSAMQVLRRTGVAALLTSLTTAAGFGSSIVAHHPGLNSLGTLALIGIGASFIAATIVFPCLLTLLEPRPRD